MGRKPGRGHGFYTNGGVVLAWHPRDDPGDADAIMSSIPKECCVAARPEYGNSLSPPQPVSDFRFLAAGCWLRVFELHFGNGINGVNYFIVPIARVALVEIPIFPSRPCCPC